ncbi:MAG: TetR/AcrR family transcriptional regulator [Prolixibacteraceae bacterium]|nr:TetR/AcrR family transcriptional regulator [Prolixibacteraceae bacterium]
MNNKKIQEERIKGYFIEATKNIIKSEGISNVSTRNIANEAGYSYATLYNYFKDVKELVFYCVQDFQEEGEIFILGKVKELSFGKERIKSISQAYVDFFLEYPNYFELFYLERLSDVSSTKQIAHLITSFLDRMSKADWEYCIKNNIYTRENAEQIKSQLNFAINGALLIYLNRKTPESYTEFLQVVEKLINGILD